jgi:hypothetical protein
MTRIATTVFLGARKLPGTVRERCFEGTLDSFCSDVESATLRDDVLEVLRLFAIRASIQNSFNERVQGVDREAVDSNGFADSVVGNAGSHSELVISDRDGDHGHTVRERLERGVEPGVGDAERGALE